MWLSNFFLLSWMFSYAALADNAPRGRAMGRHGNVDKFEYEGHQYLFYLEPRTWEEAIEICREKDAYLAVLEDPFEVKFVTRAMRGDLCTKTVFQNIWIGGRFFPESQRWLWDATGYDMAGNLGGTWNMTSEPGSDCVNLEVTLANTVQFVNIECERKRRFLCEKGCPKLYDSDRGKWSPRGCVLDRPSRGDVCKLTCSKGLELFGTNTLNCADRGWNNSIGINIIPYCNNPEEVADNIINQLDFALDVQDALIVFVLDDAVPADIFELQKKIVTELIKIFPPTTSQAVNIVSGGASLQNNMNHTLCQVLRSLSSFDHHEEPDTDRAMRQVKKIITDHQEKTPIVVFISGTPETNKMRLILAEEIKQNFGVILTIGVDDFNADELMSIASVSPDGLLYYTISSLENLKRVHKRLEQVSDFSSSVCDSHGDAVEIFIEKLNKSLAANSNLMFLLNESNLWSNDLLNFAFAFVQSLASVFPFSSKRQASLITMHPTPNVAVPFKDTDSCAFNRHVEKISRSVTKNGKALLDVAALAQMEARRVNSTGKTVVVLISLCNHHELESDLRLFVGPVFLLKLDPFCIGRTSLDLSSKDKQDRALQFLRDIPHKDCLTTCPGLPKSVRGVWEEQNCTLPGEWGQKCSFICQEKFELVGSQSLTCTEFGWEGTAGDDVLSDCKTPEEIGDAFVGKLSGILDNHVYSNFLFLLDESGSVLLENFKTELEFVDAIVDAFPLSDHRVAGLITFSNQVRNLISLQTADTCQFIGQTKRIHYRGGGTDIQKALVKAKNVIHKRAVHPQTLVFLITDGISQTDPSAVAKQLRDKGVVLFVIGVAGYKQEQLEPLASSGPDGSANFYGVKSFDVFRQISKYLNQTYHAEGVECKN